MKKYVCLLLLLSFLSHSPMAQPIYPTFILKGTINADSGTMCLLPAGEGDGAYYPRHGGNFETAVSKGKFEFRDSISYPSAFRIGLKVNSAWTYLSDLFIVEPGEQAIRCNVDSLREVPDIQNAGTAELRGWLSGLRTERWKTAGEAYQLAYVKTHPDSYVALWESIDQLMGGYEAIFDSIYDRFSVNIKKTYAGMVMAKKLGAARLTGVGRPFPLLRLVDRNNNKVTIAGSGMHSRYTLIDFWYAHCSACRDQFPKFKKIYAAYKHSGLEIIGISTDREKERNDWKTAIRQEGLDWTQYLDLGGVVAFRFSINGFPTNFLLDNKGVIIQKNVTPEELDKILSSAGSAAGSGAMR